MTESTDTKAETKTHSGTPSLDSLAGATPAMAQYIEIKTANPDCLLFFRMGDFYELFFQDAEEASRALGITLTKRGKHQGQDIPMCGVPVHAADDYLQRLIALGFRVAVCEQLEDPAQAKKRGSKAVVKRDVVRLVTPGTLTEDNLLDARQNNFLAALARRGAAEQDDYALAWVDMSTGQFKLASTKRAQLEADIARIDPSELLMADTLFSDPDLKEWMDGLRAALVPLPGGFFDSVGAEDRLTRFYEVASLDAFGTFERTEKMAAGAIVAYLEKTQVDDRPALNPPSREDSDATMLIDPATRANLELTRTLSGEKAGSLLATLDRTVTGAGSRLLTSRLASPSTSVQTVSDRYDAIDWFVGDGLLRTDTRQHLAQVPDMARSLTRLSMDRGGPRDMAAITSGLSAANEIASLLVAASSLPAEIAESIEAIKSAPFELAEKLNAALKDDLPLLKRDGGFVREGYLADLDETRSLKDQSRQIIVGLQSKYSELAEVKALKIKHNNVLGYFIEVPAQHGDKLMQAPLNETFIHRQTLANAMRFNTNELAELQSGITNAADRALGLELEIYEDLLKAVLAEETPIKQVAEALAVLDVASANAELAETQRYCRPVIDESLAFDIKAGRHPVVERALAKSMSDPFVPNDCDLTGGSEGGGLIWLITGPNMAGKSTFMRQNALIAIMAQAGLFVPAESAHIGIVDRLYSRVGAADDLARGRSTFMVEMVETAAILNQAGERSLVILDEIGRGTATFDGLSIAWAAIEHLHEANKSRALFATHYHELTALSEKLPRLSNATVKVSEWNGEVVFLHEIAPGAADRSYGIQVAKLAGLPASVVARSQEVLTLLEANDRERPPSLVDELPLFSVTQKAAPPSAAVQQESAVDKALEDINPDELTPRDALEALYKLKTLAKD